MENKKVRNATITEVDGIRFKSKMEAKCYCILKESGLEFNYESERLELNTSFHPLCTVLLPSKKTGMLEELESIVRGITYTPDFVIKIDDSTCAYIEVKGRPNDVYPLKRKLIISYLNRQTNGNTYIFVEVHNTKQLNQFIKYLKDNYYV